MATSWEYLRLVWNGAYGRWFVSPVHPMLEAMLEDKGYDFAFLNDLGSMGWELVYAKESETRDGYGWAPFNAYILKRPDP